MRPSPDPLRGPHLPAAGGGSNARELIGDGAIVGAGSVITANVEADSLSVARGKQQGYAGWAIRFRERMKARKRG